ncbi:MAG TPA: hypothetical protein VMV75_05145 [Sulfuricella sp.]|nr:hypothetical protein [Sulfuricella sp.]
MQTAATPVDPALDEFHRLMNGRLFSLLSWDQLTEFWTKVDRGVGWYLYAVGEAPPSLAAVSEQVEKFIVEMDVLLRRDHQESYCGIVYADNLDNPSLIKIYDPHNLGVSCGSSKNPPLPGWIMSRVIPAELQQKHALPGNRRRWWQNLFNQD